MWTMIVIPVREFISVVKGEWHQTIEWNSFGWLIAIIYLGVSAYYWINCLRLHKNNSHQFLLALKAKYGPEWFL